MSSGPGELAPLHRLSKDDRGPIVIIIAYSWIFVLSLVVLIRFGIAVNQRLRFKVDDFTFVLGVGFACASSVCFHLAANGGLGRHITSLNQGRLNQYYQMMYAAEMMGIAAMAWAKTSVVLLSDRVAPRPPVPFYLMLGLIAVWTIFSIFATAFQCSLPHPWVYVPSECPSRGSLQYPIIILNIITDAILATWILPTLWKLLMDVERRITVIVLFGSRFIVCGVAIGQLIAVSRHIHDRDQTFNNVTHVIWELCTINLSVLLSTIPRTNRFIAALQTSHATTLLTEFELAHPNGTLAGTQASGPKRSLSTSGAVSEPCEAHHGRSRSHSRSNQSRDPLVELPLKLTPSWDRNFSTHISSQSDNDAAEDRDNRKNSKKHSIDDWKKFVQMSGVKSHDEENAGGMLSWTSRASHGKKIVKTREVTQEVEYMPPKESRWTISKVRRQSREIGYAT
ncbi:uncharacterized protein BDR25DRAFT_305654 [Lindgomyces ingoldianus]|uniref:Uncharacterized protein n=1 Tax=Lindgomyces ingoldianus TaxID=673940 RepID=A0ACB6QK03_9PLEO|nr:uncharacterized protein BDR25DRAFT_305654 [Lindgomyces ingoldianus]KAF2467216.1 hypothetical protein BDR25DRAFT_305654 [Lindgomyces ingoldianus]